MAIRKTKMRILILKKKMKYRKIMVKKVRTLMEVTVRK